MTIRTNLNFPLLLKTYCCLRFSHLIWILCAFSRLTAADAILNEIVSSNGSTIADDDGNFEDWIEIHNPDSQAVDLAGWGLSDSPGNPYKWVFPSPTVIDAGGYLMVWASNKNRTIPGAPLHANFSISSAGETIVLTRPDGFTADSAALPEVPRNTSYGRKPGQGLSWFYFEQPTPGAANTTPGYVDLTIPPTFSQAGGFYSAGFNLDLTASPGWTVYYTLDGSDPDPSRVGSGKKAYRETRVNAGSIPVASRANDANVFSAISTTGLVYSWLPAWQAPVGKVFKGTVVKAAAYDPATGRMSKTVTRTYFVDPNMASRYGNLPVISLVSDYINLFDKTTGIYVPGNTFGSDIQQQNFFKGWARTASVEYFEGDGTPGFSGDFEISIQGNTSPAGMQKGLNVIARDEIGPSAVRQPLFEGTAFRASQLTEFKRFILRAWGSARKFPVFFADAYHQSLAATSDLDLQAYRPAIVFINGEYWGLHEMRESIKNSWYHQAYTGIDRDDPGYDLIDDGEPGTDEGDAVHWNQTVDYIGDNNLADDAVYDYVATRIDVRNFAEYIIHCVFAGKRDWPEQNESKWRPRTPDGKWRWSQYDMDHGLSDWGAPEHDMLNQAINGPISDYGPEPLLVELLENQRFKKLFINTYADWLNSYFSSPVAEDLYGAMVDELEPFIDEFDARWPNTYDWDDGIEYGLDLIERRTSLRREQLRSMFNLSSDRTVRLVADPEKGLTRINSLLVDEHTPGANAAPYPWTGKYFRNQPVDLTAVPREGYRFAGWKVKLGANYLPPVGGDPNVYSRVTTITLPLTQSGTYEVEALFEELSEAESPFPIHVWNFTSTSNPLPPTTTTGGGVMTVTPSGGTSGVTASNGFTSTHLQISNPIGTVVQWAMPTTGYRAVKLDFLTRRSSSGAGTQTLSYTLDGVVWTALPSYVVEDADPQEKSFDFSEIPGADYNPDFAVRVEFSQGAGGTGGNNRFDSLVLSGLANVAPTLVGVLPTRHLVRTGAPLSFNLEDYFTDFNGDPFSFQVTGSTAGVGVALSGSILELTGEATGGAVVTVTAESAGFAPLTESFYVLVHPDPFPAVSGEYRFNSWSSGEPAGSYPPHMLFLQSEVNDPPLLAPLDRAYSIPVDDASVAADVSFPYGATSRTRINGLGEQGISFINTGRGRDVGSAVLALDTTGLTSMDLSWTAGTIATNSRIYALTLQYRLSPGAEWVDFPVGGPPVEYVRSETNGHEMAYGPMRLPSELGNQPYVELQWRYHYLSGISGSRAEIRLDDIVLSPVRSYEDYVLQMFTEPDAGNPAVSGPLAQFSNDGSSNLLKYALGLPPSAPVTEDRLKLGMKEDGSLFARFYLDRFRTDIAYRLEVSPDLMDWSEAVFDSRNFPGPNSAGDIHEVVVPQVSGQRRFLRLGVVRE
jgi:hypothetical protein